MMFKDKWPGLIPEKDFEESKRPCRDREHNFPGLLYIPPGTSRTHTCPSCGEKTTVTAPIIYC